jgi:hypothetical protein
MKKELLKMALTQGPKVFPGVLIFLKKWWWALLLGALVFGSLGLWLAISIALWVWQVLPEILGYVLNHFAPAFEGIVPPAAAPMTPVESM